MKKTQILTLLLAHLSRNSEILFSTRSISSLLVSWLMGEIIRFSIITTQRTGLSMWRPSWSYLMKKRVRQREKAELHFQTLTLHVCLQKACLPDAHIETHTHTDNPPASWQNMIDKYQESAEEEARIIKQKENVRKLFILQR